LLVVFFLFSFHVLLTQPASWLRFACWQTECIVLPVVMWLWAAMTCFEWVFSLLLKGSDQQS
jgi:hypothetical protein